MRHRRGDNDDESHEPEVGTEEEEDVEEFVRDGRVFGVVGFVVGVAVGALLGAGITLLAAPDRGDVTRRRLGRRLKGLQDDARGHIQELRDDATHEMRRQRRRLRRRLSRRR